MDIRTIGREMAQTFVTALIVTSVIMIIGRLMQLPGAKILTDDANGYVMQTTSSVFSQLGRFWWVVPLLVVLIGLLYRRNMEKKKPHVTKRFTPSIYHDIRYEEYYDVNKVKVIKKRVTKRL